jgi:formiminotetrahydrofolate cyclodeaminase
VTNTAEQTVGGFLEALSSDAPTPGGGAAAGVAGAAGVALIAMVGRLTTGKEAYAAVDARMRELVAEADAARAEFLDLADRDASAFDGVMAAFKLPKESDEQKAEQAAAVPLECLRKAVETMPLAVEATADGNSQAASDGVSASAELLCAALCAAANVEINAAALKNQAKREALLDEVASLRARAERSLQEAQTAFQVRLSS